MEKEFLALLTALAKAFPVAMKAILADGEKIEKLLEEAEASLPAPLDFSAEDAEMRRRITEESGD